MLYFIIVIGLLLAEDLSNSANDGELHLLYLLKHLCAAAKSFRNSKLGFIYKLGEGLF